MGVGTDIHLYLEYSEDDGKTWQQYKQPIRHRVRDWFNLEGCKRVTVDLVEPEYAYRIAVGRDYYLFGIIAGIRGHTSQYKENGLKRAVRKASGEPVYEIGKAKGLPVDLSPEVAEKSKDVDEHWCHTPSWGTVGELKFWLSVHRENYGHCYGWLSVARKMEQLEKKGLKTRVVFWFDS